MARIGVAAVVQVVAAFALLTAPQASGTTESAAVAEAVPLPAKFNFQPAAAPAPSGYTVDAGAGYSDTTGYGWVTQASLSSATHAPVDLSANTRDRNVNADQRLDTLVHMQYSGSSGNPTPGAWEYAVANGTYSVTVVAGDAGSFFDSTHRVNVEGTTAIAAFAPTAGQHFKQATVVVGVADGRLTVDAGGGTNTKLDYVEIAAGSDGDTTPPAAPSGVTATPGDSSVALSWNPVTDPDLAGYNVYRSTSTPVPTTTPVNASLLTSASYVDGGRTNGTTYFYVVQSVDATGNKANSTTVSATPQSPSSGPVNLHVNFQSATAPVPTGYLRDSGEAYGARTGADQGSGLTYGWVVPGTHTPLSLVGNGRDRDLITEQRLDTFVHMQYSGSSGVSQPGSWEVAVPNGSYVVTVAVGDSGNYFDSTHQISAEGQSLISGFVPTPSAHFATATDTAVVGDGTLTINASGGTNTKIDYVEVKTPDSTPPAAPASVTATPGDRTVTLSWSANSEPDLAGYNVYRSTSTPVPRTNPLNANLLTSPGYTDNGLTNGTQYFYVVEAVDTSDNAAAAAPVSATPAPPPGNVDVKVNFEPQTAPLPAGYLRDYGQGYGARTGADQGSGLSYGWVVPGTSTPLSLVGNARDRDLNADQRLDTLIHMQYTAPSGGVAQPGSWQIAVPNGSYTVTVAVGDAANFFDSTHRINVEGQTLVNNFVPTSANHFQTSSGTFSVADGKLTLDATGGTNTKIDYVDIKTASTGGGSFTAIDWTTVAPGPIPRHEGGAAVVGTKLYVFGGYTDSTFAPTARADAYDASTNAWSQIANLPVALTHMAIAVNGQHIYLMGGYPGTGGGGQAFATTAVWDYNTGTNTYTAMPGLPAARGGGAAGISGGVLHFFGGSDVNKVDHAEHWTLDLSGGTSWQTAAPLPAARNHLAGASLNGRIYSIGGQIGQENAEITSANVNAWDPFTGAWTAVTSLPSPRSHINAATIVLGGRIIVLGGELSYNVSTAQVVAYDPTANTWTQLTPLPVVKNSGVAGNINGVIYYAGGLFTTTTYKGVPSGASSGGGTAVDLDVNFQTDTAAVPTGFVRDSGQAYGARTGADQGSGLIYGWVMPGTSTPVSLAGLGRERNIVPDQSLDTFMHMQAGTPGTWELAVANGRYNVVVGVGDVANFFDSSHSASAEGTPLITNFVPSGSTHLAIATKQVNVTDGRLTIAATGGSNTKIDFASILTASPGRPYVTASTPATAAVNVARDAAASAEVKLPNAGFGVDAATLTSSTVQLVRVSDNTPVPAHLNTSGGGDVILLQPKQLLDADTEYRFDVTAGVKDLSGSAFLPYSSTFTTGNNVSTTSNSPAAFAKVDLPTATGQAFGTLTFGPDGKLYAGTLDGLIYRFPVNADGTLGTPQILNSLQQANGGPRMLIGLAFAPGSTATNLVLWTTNTQYAFNGGDDWTGKITRLSGANLENVQDFVVGLPRSIRDHVTNSLTFGPDGKIYVLQGSNTAMGAPDDAWGNRSEHLLNAALLRVNQTTITSPPLDVKTEDGGTYNPFAVGAPVTIYASGIRNAFDLVWHSNGQLYVPTNGSAANGNTPGTPTPLPPSCSSRIDSGTSGAYTGPSVPALTSVPTAQDDFLFRVVQGGYYGHPNPSRCEWVLNGGNPTSGTDNAEVTAYPVGTQPDRNWRGAAFDFGLHFSPDGAIEYQSNAFGGALKGKLLVTRYSGGDDIIVLTPGGPNLDITKSEGGIDGMTGFTDPLDITEDPSGNGDLYVSELGAAKITLLRPTVSKKPKLELQNLDGVPYDDRLVFSRIGSLANPPANSVHDRAVLRVKNTGTDPLTVTGLPIVGPFQLVSPPALPLSVAAGSFVDLTVKFVAESGRVTQGSMTIQSNDATNPSKVVQLAGYWQVIPEGGVEPTIGELATLYGYQTAITNAGQQLSQDGLVRAVGDEVLSPYWTRADGGQPVSVRQLAAFHSQGQAASLYWFNKNFGGSATKLFTSDPSAAQMILPYVAGGGPAQGTFTPGTRFGFKVDGEWSDPLANDKTPDVAQGCPGPCGHHMRFWPVRDRSGAIVPNTFLMSMDYAGINYDYQDNVYLIRNVQPATNGAVKYRLDVGGSVNYTDTKGNVWSPDAGFFTPTTAISEGASYPNQSIANTADDPLYQTYRANLGNIPIDQRILTYNLPISGTTQVDVYLHFAERFWTGTGQRVFNIDVEGNRVSTNLDLFKWAPGQDSAFVLPFYRVTVADGTLNIAFKAVTDYGAINAIEVYADP